MFTAVFRYMPSMKASITIAMVAPMRSVMKSRSSLNRMCANSKVFM